MKIIDNGSVVVSKGEASHNKLTRMMHVAVDKARTLMPKFRGGVDVRTGDLNKQRSWPRHED